MHFSTYPSHVELASLTEGGDDNFVDSIKDEWGNLIDTAAVRIFSATD